MTMPGLMVDKVIFRLMTADNGLAVAMAGLANADPIMADWLNNGCGRFSTGCGRLGLLCGWLSTVCGRLSTGRD